MRDQQSSLAEHHAIEEWTPKATSSDNLGDILVTVPPLRGEIEQTGAEAREDLIQSVHPGRQ